VDRLAPFAVGRVARGMREDPRVVAPLAVGREVRAMTGSANFEAW
jgi:hypothetical protein